MNECGCTKNYGSGCGILGAVISIIVGIAVGILFALGLIPFITVFIAIAIIFSVISLGILLVSLIGANVTKSYNAFDKCICSTGKNVLLAAIGTLLVTTVALVTGVVAVSILSIILVSISTFLFVWLVILITKLLWCVIDKTCRKCEI